MWELRPPKHPKTEINNALDYAARQGFVVEQTAAGHKWGRIKCGCSAMFSVWSTPKIPLNHRRQIRRWVDQHNHGDDEEG